MGLSRRGFVASIAQGLAATTAAAWLNEVRPAVNAAEATRSWSSQDSASPVVRILFNENPLGPSPKAIEAVNASIKSANFYPFSNASRLEMKLRAKFGMPTVEVSDTPTLGRSPKPESDSDLILGVGSSEILRAVAWAYGANGGNTVEPYPSYSALGREAESHPGSTVERRIVNLDKNNKIDIQAIVDAADEKTRVIMICNPNNPTGTMVDRKSLEYLVANVSPRTLVFIDEAYIEFVPNAEKHSAMSLALSQPNVLVTRTFSKIYGLAGLRVGYGVGHAELIEGLRPYMLGQLAYNAAGLVAAHAALDDQAHLEKTVALNQRIQKRWEQEMPEFGFKYTRSFAGFAWINTQQNCTALVEHLRSDGVLIGSGSRWNLPNHVRISLGNDQDVDTLMTSIKRFVG